MFSSFAFNAFNAFNAFDAFNAFNAFNAFITFITLFALLSAATPSFALPPEIDALLDSRLKNQYLGPIYKPTLFRHGYLNKTQQDLAKTAGPLEPYIRFVEPTDKDISTYEVSGIKAKKWTDSEKGDVHRIFEHIFQTTPGLLMRAASGIPLVLVRTSGINRPENMSTDLKHSNSMSASASPLSINFADDFFLISQQHNALVHELVHSADYYGQISRSKKWIEFAEPITSKIRIKVNFLSAFEKRDLALRLRRDGDWVSLYGCENLFEALAEYASTYITNRDRVLDSDFEKDFANPLLMPTPRDLESGRYYKLGCNAYNHGQFDEAINQYSKCIAIDPEAAMPHVRLAVNLAKKSEYGKAIAECQTAEACFKKVHIPADDSEYSYLLEWKSTIAYRTRNYQESIDVMTEVLENRPPTRDKFYGRYWAEDISSRYAAAALDLYEWHCANAVNDYIYSGMSDWRYTMQLLDSAVTKFPGFAAPLVRRARFLETRGDAAIESDKKQELYAQALADYTGTIGKSDCVKERAFLDCGRLCYKMGRVDQIQQYLDKMEDASSDEKDVLQIVLADGRGDRRTAVLIYKSFKNRMIHRGNPDSEKPFNYITNLPLTPFSAAVSSSASSSAAASSNSNTAAAASSSSLSSLPAGGSSTQSNIEEILKSKIRMSSRKPDYEPALPPKIPLNLEQVQLLKESGPLENYIRFVEPGDKDAATFIVNDRPLKKWSEPEKEDIHRTLTYIFAVAPGLIIHAASGEKVALARIDSMPIDKPLITCDYGAAAYHAVAGPVSIVLCDVFFGSSNQCNLLVHELVHEADSGGHIAYSKEWVDFTQPTLPRMRIWLNFLAGFQKRNLSATLDRGAGDWVSLYGCENLNEALAECATTCINSRKHYIDPKFIHLFGNRLLIPDPQELTYNRYYKLGRNALEHKDYEAAIAPFRSSIACDPNAALAHSGLACALEETKQYDQALAECLLAEACFARSHVPPDDSSLGDLLERKATIAFDTKNYELALATLDKLLFNDPLNRDGLYKRMNAASCLGRPALASVDLYDYIKERKASDFVSAGTFDPDYTLQLLDREVEQFPAFGAQAARRARFLESMGDAEIDSVKKKHLYDRSLNDFKMTIDKSDCSETRSYLDCGRLCFKLGQSAQIQSYTDKIGDDSDGDEKSVLKILFLESTGKHEKALVMFRNLRTKLHPTNKNEMGKKESGKNESGKNEQGKSDRKAAIDLRDRSLSQLVQ